MAEPAERRKGDNDLNSKIDALIGMLTMHMTKEELDLAELKAKVDAYFHELDAHTHVFHHSKVAEKIKTDDETQKFWSRVKGSALEKGIIFVSGVVAMYLLSLVWLDFGNKVAAMPMPPQTIPAYVQPAQPKPPPVSRINTDVPTRP